VRGLAASEQGGSRLALAAHRYAELYRLADEATSFSRGTLRYRGWSELMDGFATFGLTGHAPAPRPADATTWPQLLRRLGVPRDPAGCESFAEARAVEALHWLGAWDEGEAAVGESVSDAFCALLQSRLAYQSGERDAVLMEHVLDVEWGGAGRPRRAETITSTLVGFGDADGGPSAMSRSVGLTAAAGVMRLVAPPSESLPPLAGVLRPTEPSVWQHALPLLEAEGIRFRESVRAA